MITTYNISNYDSSVIYPHTSIVEYLAWKGFQPSSKRGSEYLYRSPFRQETRPSFSVNDEKGVWVDRGMPGKYANQGCFGGTIYLLAEVLCGSRAKGIDDINACFMADRNQLNRSIIKNQVKLNQNTIKVKNHNKLQHPALLEYIASRGILIEAANKICREVWYFNTDGKINFSVGMKNQSGGWELSSKGFKGSISPKDIFLFSNGSDRIVVFEGLFDLLSYISMGIEKRKSFSYDWLCLNSTSLVKRALTFLSVYKEVCLMLDNDTAGDIATKTIMESIPFARDFRSCFVGYNDLNDWWRIFHCKIND